MSPLTTNNERTCTTRRKTDTQWSDLDKPRLFGIGASLSLSGRVSFLGDVDRLLLRIAASGSVLYSALAVALHPLTVIKIRKQTHAPPASSAAQYYRGLGVVVTAAIPARILYVSSLELSRELADVNARQFIASPPVALSAYREEMSGLLPLVTPFAGGVAGGVAALSSQLIVVPMDVVSQKLMVMEDSVFKEKGSAMKVARSIVNREGIPGLYKGFGLSLFTSLPAGSIWWASYSGCKELLSNALYPHPGPRTELVQQGIIQVASAFSAAVAASVLTQPLDTIKTRLQVGSAGSKKLDSSLLSLAREMTSMRSLYKGLLPRIAHMGVWGSVLSAAYEGLKLVSRKDYGH